MTTPAITSIEAQLVLADELRLRAELTRVLAALEADEVLAPRRWGASFSLRAPYDRKAILEHVATEPVGEWALVLRRAQPVNLLIEIAPGCPSMLAIEATGHGLAAHRAELFAAIDRVAVALDVEFGVIDVRFADQDPATFSRAGGSIHCGAYQRWGPPTVFPRTYFGRRVCALVEGPKVFEMSGGVARETDGPLVLDLLPEPWTAGPAVLKRAQVRVEMALRVAGIIAREAGEWRTLAAPRWVPLSVER